MYTYYFNNAAIDMSGKCICTYITRHQLELQVVFILEKRETDTNKRGSRWQVPKCICFHKNVLKRLRILTIKY